MTSRDHDGKRASVNRQGGRMEQFHTEREQGFVALATQLGQDFSTRAAQYDELGEFPYKNY